jgi:hypothetical protein
MSERDEPKTDIWGRKTRRGPEPVATFLDALLAKVTTAGGSVMVRLVGEWDRVAGREWAGRSTPVALRNGILVVGVPNGSAASLLRFQVAALQQRLNAEFGDGTVVEVRLRVDRTSAPPQPPAQADRKV